MNKLVIVIGFVVALSLTFRGLLGFSDGKFFSPFIDCFMSSMLCLGFYLQRKRNADLKKLEVIYNMSIARFDIAAKRLEDAQDDLIKRMPSQSFRDWDSTDIII